MAAGIIERLAADIAVLGAPDVTLATVLVGYGGVAESQIDLKRQAAHDAGMGLRHHGLPSMAEQVHAEVLIDELALDSNVHGIFVQLPVPSGWDTAEVLDHIPKGKDVDHRRPCTAEGIVRLLDAYGIGVADVVVVGELPGAAELLHARPVDPGTSALASVTRQAALLVSAANRPHLIGAHHVRPGATVVDAGTGRTPDGRLCGDVDTEAVTAVAGALCPMPGGVGPMTVACLLAHTLDNFTRGNTNSKGAT